MIRLFCWWFPLCTALVLGLVVACEAPPCEGPNCPECTQGDTRSCYPGPTDRPVQPPCQRGEQTCTFEGKWGDCVDAITPRDEICGDEKDNDCNGIIDDNCECKPNETRTCGLKVGECTQGTQTCDKGKWQDCQGATLPTEERCEGEKDEDCDGLVDEECACIKGQKRPCGSAQGECKEGEQSCDEKGKWGNCVGEVGPQQETCDQKDNDCDGQIDNGITCP